MFSIKDYASIAIDLPLGEVKAELVRDLSQKAKLAGTPVLDSNEKPTLDGDKNPILHPQLTPSETLLLVGLLGGSIGGR